MKEVIYSSHLEFRIKIREIPYWFPKQIYETAREKYFDNLTKKKVAVKRVLYKDRNRDMAVIYEEDLEQVKLVTIHPLKFLQKFNRIKTKRWRKI